MSEENGSSPEGGSNPLDLLSGYNEGGALSAQGPVPEIKDGPGAPEAQEAEAGGSEEVSEAVSEVSEPDVSSDPAKEQAARIQEELTKVNTYTAKNGNESVDLRADALIPVKIDGEVTEVPLSDLRNNYSGKVAYDRKFQELGHKNRELTTRLSQFESIGENLESNPLSVIDKLAEATGVDRGTVFENMLAQAIKLSEEVDELGEDGKKSLIENYRLKAQREALEAKEKQVNEKTTQAELEAWTRGRLDETGVTESELGALWRDIEADKVRIKLPENQKEAVDKLINYIQVDKAYSKIESVVDELAPELSENDQFIDTIYKVAGHLPRKEIEAIVTEYKGSNKKEDSSTELAPTENEGQAIQGERAPSEERWKPAETYGNELLDMVMSGKL